MHEAEGAAFLLDTEPAGAVRSVRALIYSCGCLVFEYLYDLIEYAGGDGQICVSPRNMFDDRDLNRREVLIAESSLLLFHLS
jgi:hypothetical protein